VKCIFSVDVEDWFHILDLPVTPPVSEWASLPSRVEQNFLRLLAIFRTKEVEVTCFFLGWIAERFPHLVKAAQADGHEIAAHGYSHELVYKLTDSEFLEDASKSRTILEDITGSPIRGYRSAGFSTTESTPWFFDKLAEAGYHYDSSVFPAPRGHGGMRSNHLAPYRIEAASGPLLEFPISVVRVLGKPVCFFGGGYLRLFPYPVIRNMATRVLGEGRPVVFYLHPRDIDPDHPRLSMGRFRRFKSYVNLKTTATKVARLLDDFEFTTFSDFISDHPELRGVR
jgi:polysaccharide deacetylase family protein (PEP-CTERM system associated)